VGVQLADGVDVRVGVGESPVAALGVGVSPAVPPGVGESPVVPLAVGESPLVPLSVGRSPFVPPGVGEMVPTGSWALVESALVVGESPRVDLGAAVMTTALL